MSMNVTMPEMGEGVIEGRLMNWLVQEGDFVKEDDPILEIETDKVTVEVNAEATGKVLKILVPSGQIVTVGMTLAIIGAEGEEPASTGMQTASASATASASTPHKPAAKKEDQSGSNGIDQQPIGREFDGLRVSPVVSRMLREHDINIAHIKGTGRDGRVTKHDVLAYLDQDDSVVDDVQTWNDTPKPTASAPQPKPMTTMRTNISESEGETLPLSGMRRSIAEHMVISKRVSPHATTVFEFDYSAVSAHRREHKADFAKDGIKLTYMPYLVQAVAEALKKHRMVNSAWMDDGILQKRNVHIGMAVAVPQGLFVPVIRHADTMNLLGLARVINDFAERGRTNKIKPDELQGGTFTVTNHGASGSLIGTPIINQPQAGILGVGLIEKRVKVIGDAIGIRPCAYVSFSFDHRILDGATADAFVMDVKHRIENWS